MFYNFGNNSIKSLNYKTEKLLNKHFVDFKFYGIYINLCNCDKFYIRKTIRSLEIKCNRYVSELKCNKYSPKFCLGRLNKRNNCSAAISLAAMTAVKTSKCVGMAVAEHGHLSWKADFLPDFHDIAVDALALFDLWCFNFNYLHSERLRIYVFFYYFLVLFLPLDTLTRSFDTLCVVFDTRRAHSLRLMYVFSFLPRWTFFTMWLFSTHAVYICTGY